jgi:hypothetical protein
MGGIIGSESEDGFHKALQFAFRPIDVDELFLSPVNGSENEVVSGHVDVNDVSEIDCPFAVADEFHISHFLGYTIYYAKSVPN